MLTLLFWAVKKLMTLTTARMSSKTITASAIISKLFQLVMLAYSKYPAVWR